MSIYNYILENLILPLGDLVLQTHFISSLKKARKLDRLSKNELAKYQKQRLEFILNHASTNSKYYQSLNIQPSKDPIDWLSNFPILEKSDLNMFGSDMLTCEKKRLIEHKSSGSSGVQSIVYWKTKEWSEVQAFQTHWWEWAGYKLGNPILQTGITTNRGLVKSVKDFLTKTNYLPAFTLEKEVVEKNLIKLEKKMAFLGGYASSLYVLAGMAEAFNSQTNFISAISWGDKLFPNYRKEIEKAFGCKTYETYGTSEGFMIASQKDLDYLYINTPQVYLELLDDDGMPVSDGSLGNVVVTNLINTAMPLIRYKIGDIAIKLPINEYPKDRELAYPLLKKIIGRDTDIIKTRSGKSLVVHTFTGIIEHYQEIKQFRVVQEVFDEIIIEYIPKGNDLSNILLLIEEDIYQKTNTRHELKILFKQVFTIPSTKSGKPQIIESKLKGSKPI